VSYWNSNQQSGWSYPPNESVGISLRVAESDIMQNNGLEEVTVINKQAWHVQIILWTYDNLLVNRAWYPGTENVSSTSPVYHIILLVDSFQ
jgi:hypothetical protein